MKRPRRCGTIRSLYIKEFTAEVDNGKISNYRINAKVTFRLGARIKKLLGTRDPKATQVLPRLPKAAP